MKLKRRIAGFLLAVCMTAGLLPAEISAAGNNKAIQLVDRDSGSAANISGGQVSSVYYGTYRQSSDGGSGYNSAPIKWRVLSNENNQLFLLADQNLDVFQYHVDVEDITWEGSTMRSWLNGYDKFQNTGGIDYSADSFFGSAFSDEEKNAISVTHVENEGNTEVPGLPISGGNPTEDKIFLLSLSEVRNVDYGFSTDATRVSTNTAYAASGGKIFDINNGVIFGNAEGRADYWWLRSPGNAQNRAAAVSVMGVVLDGPLVDSDTYAVRPAFNLDIQSVLFTSAAVGGKVPAASGGAYSEGIFEIETYNRDDWKTTILDKDRGFAVFNVQISGSTVTFSYSGAETGASEYISAVIMENGEITHYGRVLELDGTMNGAAGDNVAVSIPAGVTLGAGTELYLFNEQYNGGVDDDTKLTDYASAFVKAEDTAAPSLTAGAVSRTSDTGAEVKFTSSEAGTYYYEVVDSGASMPNIDTTGAGMTCDRSEQTITLNNLTVGAKDIYIVVKDDVGHIS